MNTSTKRKRIVLDIEQKVEIIERLEQGDSVNFLALIYDVGKSTISDIRKNKDSLINFALNSRNSPRKRKAMKLANNVALEESVYAWYLEKLNNGETVPGPLLCEKALDINKEMGGPQDFKASTGWLKHFKLRHGIGESAADGDTLLEDAQVDSFKTKLLEIVERGRSANNKSEVKKPSNPVKDENIMSSPDLEYYDIDKNCHNQFINNSRDCIADYKKHKAKCKINGGNNYERLDKISLLELFKYMSTYVNSVNAKCDGDAFAKFSPVKEEISNSAENDEDNGNITAVDLHNMTHLINSNPEISLYCNKEKLMECLDQYVENINQNISDNRNQ